MKIRQRLQVHARKDAVVLGRLIGQVEHRDLATAGAVNLDIAHMSRHAGIIVLLVVIDKIAEPRRYVEFAHQIRRAALDAVHHEFAIFDQIRIQFRIQPQGFTREPDRTFAVTGIKDSLIGIAVIQIHAARGISMIGPEADGVFLGIEMPATIGQGVIRGFRPIPVHPRTAGFHERGIVVSGVLLSALRKDHGPLRVEDDIADFVIRALWIDVQFPTGVAQDGTGCVIDPNRPDLWPRALRDRIEKPPPMHRHSPDPTFGPGIGPGVGVFAVKPGIRHVQPVVGVKRDRRKAGAHPRRDTVVKLFEVKTIKIKPVDHSGIAVRNKQLVVAVVKSDVAKARPRIFPATQRYVGKKADLTGASVDLVNGPRPAKQPRSRAGTRKTPKLPVHETGLGLAEYDPIRQTVAVPVGQNDIETKGRSRAKVDVRRFSGAIGISGPAVVNRNAEDLTDIAGLHLVVRVQIPKAGIPEIAGLIGQVEPRGNAHRVNKGHVRGRHTGWEIFGFNELFGVGKPGDDR